MAFDIFQALDLHGNEARNLRLHNLPDAPAHAVGLVYWDTDDDRAYISDGVAWLPFGAVGDNEITQAKLADNSVGTAEIINLNVTTGKLADLAVTTGKIGDGQVTGVKIADGSITGGAAGAGVKIAAATITNDNIAAGAAIAKSKLAALNIADADVAAGAAIAKSKLAALNIVNADVDAGAAIAMSKLNLAITNAEIAAGAAIAKSKLAALAIVDADVSAGAAIAKSKLAALNIVNSDIAAGAAIALSKLATDPLARANHTGTQLAATISDFNTAVRLNRLDQMAVPTADVSLNGVKITNLAEPTAAQDAATKNYVDLMRQGIRLKDAVRAATTANIANLAGGAPNVVDGVNLAANDRVLVKDQADHSQDGLYVVQTLGTGANGTWVRADDASTFQELQDGTTTFVQEGTANNAKTYSQTNVLASLATAQSWALQGAAAAYLGGAGMVLNGSTFDIQTADGTITVNADSIQVGVIQTANIANDAVTQDKIGDGAVGDAQVAAGIAVAKITGAMQRHTQLIGNAAATSFVVNHARGTDAVTVEVFYAGGTKAKVYPDIKHTDANNVTVEFTGYTPALNEFRVVVVG